MTSVSTSATYDGPERRRHRMYVTRNTEYHTRDGICVAVRNLRTGLYEPDHHALGKRAVAGLVFGPGGGIESMVPANEAHAGIQLCFTSGKPGPDREVITSALKSIERPTKDIVLTYP